MKKYRSLLLLAVLSLASLACSWSVLDAYVQRLPFAVAVERQSGNSAPVDTDALPLPREAEELVNQPASETGTSFPQSYRSSLTMSLSGVDQNALIVNEVLLLTQEVVNNRESYHLGYFSESNQEIKQRFDLYTLASQNLYWDQKGPGGNVMPCINFSAAEATEIPLDLIADLSPENLFRDIEKGELLESGVWVNNVMSDHYRASDPSMASDVFSTISGDIWIAQDGGYVVRFYGEGQGQTTSMQNGNDVDGKVVWQYDLSDVNRVREIVLPPECQLVTKDSSLIPIPDNATSLNISLADISFDSPDSPGTVAANLRESLSENRFSERESSDFEDRYIFVYDKDGKVYTIVVSPAQEQGSQVWITWE